MSRQEKAKYAMGEEHPSLSNLPVNLGKKPQCFRDEMLHTFPARKAHSAPGVCSPYLKMVPENCTLVNNRKELPVSRTPETTYEPFPSDPISGKRCICACQEQSLHVEITEQHSRGFFQDFIMREWGSFLLTAQFWLQRFMHQLSQVEQSRGLEELEGHTNSQVLPLAKVELMQNSHCVGALQGNSNRWTNPKCRGN